MITITYNKNMVSITGHAEYAAHGNDIVCAGVSTAFFYTCELITRAKSEVEITTENDLFKINFKQMNDTDNLIFDTFIAILNEIQNKYTKNIKMSEVK